MKQTTILIGLTAALLSACGQTPAPSTPQTQGLSDYAQHRAALPGAAASTGPNAPRLNVQRADGQRTDLDHSLPAGALQGQSLEQLDKSVPIILVHGLGGWGDGELLGFNYWGGPGGTVADLRSQGYTVYAASLGPVISNWDRASELFAQIRGGCVDYGAAHSAAAGHRRTDPVKCYPGFYPQWDAAHPVNLIGHSMGGPTSLALVSLLDRGSPADAAGSNLFAGGRAGWVKSVMTISGANSGSPATDQLVSALPLLKDLILSAAALGGGTTTGNSLYDMDMGQWGLRRQAGESLNAYLTRAFQPNSPLWKSEDQAAFDLSVEGAYQQNARLPRSEHTRYFSWASSDTYPGLLTGWHYPRPTMAAPLHITAFPYAWPLPPGLGNLRGTSAKGTVTYGPEWWENDGLVPVYAQHAPLGQSSVAYTGQTTQPGQWYRLGKMEGYDHLDAAGLLTLRDFRQFYRDQAAFLSSLK
ncbi:esterase/lipase family protein [Deinococcus sp. Marseille-Q6407]|uniref:esterase/lipase family protein n=1 Tax=Deinococcus sp. Marseille-Q6407 TaxID=2969223 RepID=UPI0021BE6FD6|nr:triacylglycerol lipase [Deinococcus sp. Marseille-Q6407]